MKMIIELTISADMDEETMTVDDKLDFVEEIIHTGCELCCANYYLKLLEIKEG
jgi:uncharacterized protein YutD